MSVLSELLIDLEKEREKIVEYEQMAMNANTEQLERNAISLLTQARVEIRNIEASIAGLQDTGDRKLHATMKLESLEQNIRIQRERRNMLVQMAVIAMTMPLIYKALRLSKDAKAEIHSSETIIADLKLRAGMSGSEVRMQQLQQLNTEIQLQRENRKNYELMALHAETELTAEKGRRLQEYATSEINSILARIADLHLAENSQMPIPPLPGLSSPALTPIQSQPVPETDAHTPEIRDQSSKISWTNFVNGVASGILWPARKFGEAVLHATGDQAYQPYDYYDTSAGTYDPFTETPGL
ncbi:hypothetical protein HK100_001282 [Physocladia obscura]|uniref:Uncharacterized protein n=1 Tax=Physocladia obscura TaxID=109957 RepID=A0AAD5TAB4_9FUNG|nr:hypothetical protein HK100_001282 [Physocladia obscura]